MSDPHETDATPTGAASAARDADLVEVIADFLDEGAEGLARADEILIAVEQGAAGDDDVHALFRVFHTIKGVAGFLELGDVVALAHATEALLNRVREGERALAGDTFQAVFEATGLLQRRLEALREAVDARADLAPDVELPALVARVEALIVAPAPAAPLVTGLAGEPGAAPAAWEPEPVSEPDAGARRLGAGLRETVRVDVERVDTMVEMIGELMIVQAMVVHSPEIAALGSVRLRNSVGQLTKLSRDLQEVAMRMRMVPVRGVFHKVARLTRELSRRSGKRVVLQVEGADAEVDRSMVERLEDPLVHLVRNAVDHGIESAAERRAAGKPEVATLRLSARHEGGTVALELTDDGRGLDRDRILERARERGLVPAGAELADRDVHELVFLPGFSTAREVTEISGRGVGLDVVKRAVEATRGRVSVSSEPGRGTTFRMVLPLTLAVIDGMLVSCGAERYVLPSLSVIESLRGVDVVRSTPAGRAEVATVRGETMPLLRLHRVLAVPGDALAWDDGHVVVIEGAGCRVAIAVDEVLSQQQLVIKALGNGLERNDLLSGAAILSDGRVGLILDADRLSRLATTGVARPGATA